MSLPIYQRVAVTDAGDVIPGAEYTVINENTGVAQPIYSDRTGATLLTPPYFADSVGTIQFFIAQGTTFRVAASGGVGTYTDRYVYGVAEAVLVQADGNVGIGTSSTNGLKAVILGATGYPETTGTTQTGVLRLSGGTGLYNVLDMGVNESTNTAWMQSTRANSLGVYDDFALQPNGGDVGIGTTNPNSLGSNITTLNIKGGVSDRTGGLRLTSLDNSVDGYIYGADGLMTFGTQSATPVRFLTGGTERMRIASNGDILMGASVSTGGARLEVTENAGNLVFFKNSSGVGLVLGAGGTAWVVTSDERVKNIIEPITGAMSKLSTLRTVIGKYKVDPDGTRRPFLIAQDVQAVFPEVINTQDDKDGTLGIEYTSLIPSMIAAMKEQQALIEALTARITALEAK